MRKKYTAPKITKTGRVAKITHQRINGSPGDIVDDAAG